MNIKKKYHMGKGQKAHSSLKDMIWYDKKSKVEFKYKLHNQELEVVSNTKYLGVTIQDDGKFDLHVSNTTNNAGKPLLLNDNPKATRGNHIYLNEKPKLKEHQPFYI